MSDPKLDLFRHAANEEPFNDFFTSLLARADTAEILNTIHEDDPITFGEGAKVVATQRDGLPDHPETNSKKRTLDWVVKDQDKLVGYESKRTDTLSGTQLKEEYQKLQYNTSYREVHLFAFTEHVSEPTGIDAEFTWKRWSNVGKNIITSEPSTTTQTILADLFKYMNYTGFTGFTTKEEAERIEDWFVIHQNEAVEFVTEATEMAEGLQFYHRGTIDHHNRVDDDLVRVKQKNHRGFGPPYYVFSVHPIGYRDADTSYNISNNGYYIAIVIPALRNDVYTHMNIYGTKDDEAQRQIKQSAAEIVEVAAEHDMHLQTSKNSLFTTPTPLEYDLSNDSERRNAIQDLKENFGQDSWKRARFGWKIDTNSSASEILAKTTENIEQLHDVFYNEVERHWNF